MFSKLDAWDRSHESLPKRKQLELFQTHLDKIFSASETWA
jgi:hypothetical protein